MPLNFLDGGRHKSRFSKQLAATARSSSRLVFTAFVCARTASAFFSFSRFLFHSIFIGFSDFQQRNDWHCRLTVVKWSMQENDIFLVRWGSCAGDTLLPKNVQRRQWVNRNHRHKVVFNVAGNSLCRTVLKLYEWRLFLRMRVYSRLFIMCSNTSIEVFFHFLIKGGGVGWIVCPIRG